MMSTNSSTQLEEPWDYNHNGSHNFTLTPNISNLVTLFSVVVIPAIVAHSLALFALCKDLKDNITPVKGLLLGLCVVDVVGIVVIAVHHLIGEFVEHPPFSVCAAMVVLMTFVSLMSGAMATMMAAERCMAMRAPFWYRVNKSQVKTFVLPLTLVFLVLFGVSLLGPTPLGSVYKVRGDNPCPVCSSFPENRISDSIQGVFSISFTIAGLTIVFVNVSINIAVVVALRGMNSKTMRVKTADADKHVVDVVEDEKSQPSSGKKTAEYELTKMLFILSATFLICSVPIYISRIMNDMGYDISHLFRSVSHTLAGLNYVIDPIIYIIAMKSYRRRVQNLFCHFCRYKSKTFNDIRSLQKLHPSDSVSSSALSVNSSSAVYVI